MSSATEPGVETRIAWLPLLTALAIVLTVTAYPRILADGSGGADHVAAGFLFWAMSAGFVRGVGFVPRQRPTRLLLSGPACLAGVLLAACRLL
ncbi:MAG: cyd operon YbgE family protein [Rhodocyclaceae bacterium]|nr:cyd operon YbgE family protein [Rhodocyclaceae bacterium]